MPGSEGQPGADGTSGTNGLSAFTVTTAAFSVPALGGSVGVPVAQSSTFAVDQSVFIPGAGMFTITAIPSSVALTLEYTNWPGNTNALALIPVGTLVTPSGPIGQLSGPLPNAIVDNTGGVASDTLASGVGNGFATFARTFSTGVAAGDAVTDIIFGFRFEIISWFFVTDVPGTGAGATRIWNLEIDSVDVGTIVSTLNTTLASTAAKGQVTASTSISGANIGSAVSTFSIEVAAGGTQFATGSGTFLILLRNLDAEDAIASLAAHVNDLIASLT